MRHLWTTVTTERTVTHDAGEPEWLDLPLSDFLVEAPPVIVDQPVVQELDPPWLLQSKWMMDEFDVGYALVPTVEYRDPLGFTLYNEEILIDNFEELFMPREFSSAPVFALHRTEQLRYTVPGVYTFIVRWLGSPATREAGQFSILITDLSEGERDE